MENKIILRFKQTDYRDLPLTDHYGTFVHDIHNLIPNDYDGGVIDILLLYVDKDYRRKGVASQRLSNLINLYPDNIIFAIASPTTLDFPKRPLVEECEEFFTTVDIFYNKNNFKSVNFATKYDQSVPYMYVGNEIGKKIYDDLRRVANLDRKKLVSLRHTRIDDSQF